MVTRRKVEFELVEGVGGEAFLGGWDPNLGRNPHFQAKKMAMDGFWVFNNSRALGTYNSLHIPYIIPI